MSPIRHLILVGVVVTVVTGCGDGDIELRYDAERFLWRAEHDRGALPGRALADGGDAWRDHAERFLRIAASYEPLAAGTNDENVRREILDVTARARWRALDAYVRIADSTGLRAGLDALIDAPAYPDPVVVAALRRRADVAASEDDVERRLDDLRAVWSRVRGIPSAAARQAGVPHEIVRARPDDESRAWAVDEYTVMVRSADDRLRRAALLEFAALDVDTGAPRRAYDLLEPEVRAIVSLPEPSGDEIGFVLRAVEILSDALAAGAVRESELTRALAFVASRSIEPGRAYLALADALARRGDTGRALEITEEIRRWYDDSVWGPRATRVEAEIHIRAERWQQAELSIGLLRTRYALSLEALETPLEFVRALYARDLPVRAGAALDRTVAQYRDVFERYPAGGHTDRLRACLATALELRGDTDEAFALRLVWTETVRDTAAELERLVTTLRAGERMLRPESELLPLRERLARQFPHTRAGRAAAARLR